MRTNVDQSRVTNSMAVPLLHGLIWHREHVLQTKPQGRIHNSGKLGEWGGARGGGGVSKNDIHNWEGRTPPACNKGWSLLLRFDLFSMEMNAQQ